MKDNFEMKEFKKRYGIITLIALLLLWCLAWFLCDFYAWKACVFTGAVAVLVGVLYFVAAGFLRSLYKDVDEVSKVMLEVVEGREDYHAEVYKQGSMGLLYTNFYKMVTALRESQLKTGEEKEFLKETISDISHQLKKQYSSN